MKEKEIVKIDPRGRIVIPRTIRKKLGIKEGNQLVIYLDEENSEIKLIPVMYDSAETKLMRYKIFLSDEAGSLAKIATLFGELGISLIHGQATVISRGKEALFEVIGPKPKDLEIDEIIQMLVEKGNAKKVQITEVK